MLSVSLHPLVVHFAIALLLVGPAMDTVGLLLRRESLLLTGRWNVIIGAVMLALAELSGFTSSTELTNTSQAGQALLNLHLGLGYVCIAIWLPAALWRALSPQLLPLKFRTLYLTLSYTGAALVLAQAALGTALVYRHGVGLTANARAEPATHTAAPPVVVDHPRLGAPKN